MTPPANTQTNSSDGWSAEDFVDQSGTSLSYDDPWDPTPPLRKSPSPTSVTPVMTRTQRIESPRVQVVIEENEQSYLSEDTSAYDSSQTVETYSDEFDYPSSWYEGAPYPKLDEESLEEPDVTFEFDLGLSEELYQEAEFIDLTSDVDIRLDKFLADIALTEEQDKQVRRHFKNFSRSRLSNWLPWLNSKIWTGQTLLLFIQFHDCWENNPEWWESRRLHWRYGWQPKSMPMSNILSRNDAYLIVHRRIDLAPAEMINPVWFDEWDYHSLWRHGFFSFAQFAKFRSTLNDEEEWESLVSWQIPHRDVESYSASNLLVDWTPDAIYGGFPIRENGISTLTGWYNIQDWYPKEEWHDNLGWEISRLGTSHSHNTEGYSQGPIWPIGGRNE